MPSLARIVFFGTPEFAVPTLAALVAAGRRPALVVTQPARPAGRGQRPRLSPVAAWAAAQGLEVAEPVKVRDPAFLDRLRALAPDVAVVVAFGQIFPAELLALPAQGCINVHASLLPAHRGASPIQAAILAGDEATGVTTMRMEAGLDSGPMLLRAETPIGGDETAGELAARLSQLGAGTLLATLEALEAGTLRPVAQDDAAATYAPRIGKEDGRVDWSLSADDLGRRLRAFTPWPGLTAELRGAPVRLARAAALAPSAEEFAASEAPPGTFLGLLRGRLVVACGGGTRLAIDELQRSGRRAVRAVDFANGERLRVGERLS